ncbi:membrane lipoprotein lipid attachment site-containing protein [Kangiella sp. HZ709]|uniref:membrane lipoprotein lipid attachment site-containing protein n=1 Tax=Kangiella sp. HZ709 TaxID=2666328 RepID=UPI0012AFDFFA|nr:membrane lipoprotein lipid attachment site-containing protein [Kangiella sp. HZ709]MRX28249.1 hypothetical protein [Kangiella sp. HZ709]
MKKIILALSIVVLTACSTSTVQKVAKVSRILTGGDPPRSAFLDSTVKEALAHEMSVCLDGNENDIELRAECAKIAVAKVKEQKGLEEDIDLGGEVIVRRVDEDEVIDGTKEGSGESDEIKGDDDQ